MPARFSGRYQLRRVLCRKTFLILAYAVAPALAQAQTPMRLLNDVSVEGDSVRLADLLPPTADSTLKSAEEKVTLGRAPQVGSFRILDAAKIKRVAGANPNYQVPEQVIVRRRGWAIDTESIRLALRKSQAARQFDFSRAKISPPPDFVARESNSQLELTGLRPDRSRNVLLANLRCKIRAQCASFVVEIASPQSTLSLSLRPPNPRFDRRPGATGVSPVQSPALVEPKRLATLIIEADQVRITEPVMPQGPARLGELVRVNDPVSHHSLLAEVVGPGLVRLSATSAETSRSELK